MVAHHAKQNSFFVLDHSTATGKARQTGISKQISTICSVPAKLYEIHVVLLRSSPPTSPPQWIASTASPPPPRWQLMFSTVGVQ